VLAVLFRTYSFSDFSIATAYGLCTQNLNTAPAFSFLDQHEKDEEGKKKLHHVVLLELVKWQLHYQLLWYQHQTD
jgi:hypothetical protein